MRKRIIVSIMILCTILFSMNIVNAATGNASLTASSTSVKPGDTFTVTLSVNCEDGINGVNTTYSYDEDKLELVSANVASNNWASLGVNGTIQVICNSTSELTSENIYVLTFKVKDNATVGTTAKVSTSEIKVDSDVSTSNYTEVAKSVSINIISVDSNTSNGNNEGNQNSNASNNNNEGNQTSNISNNNNGGNQNSNTTNNNNEGNQTSNASNNNNEGNQASNISNNNNVGNQNSNTSGNNNGTVGGTNKDASTATLTLPNTGGANHIWMIFVGGIAFTVVGYYLIRIKRINK